MFEIRWHVFHLGFGSHSVNSISLRIYSFPSLFMGTSLTAVISKAMNGTIRTSSYSGNSLIDLIYRLDRGLETL